MDLDDLSYLHVLNADETEDVTKRLSKILQEAAENNSPDVDTLWKIILHLWTVIDNVPYRIPIPPLEGIPIESTILLAEDMKTQKYASFIQTVYKWLALNRQTNTHFQALSNLGRYKPGLDAEVIEKFNESARNPDQEFEPYIKSFAHHALIKGVIKRCAKRGKYLTAPIGCTLNEDGEWTTDEEWEREEEEREKKKEKEQKEQGKKEKKGEQEKKSEKVEEKGKRSEKEK